VQQPCDQTGNVLGAIGSGDADDGNAAIVVGLAVVWCIGGLRKQVVADRQPDRAGRAFGGLEVHQQPRPGVDFDDRTALQLQRLRNILCHHIHTCNVQAHDAGSQRNKVVNLGVNLVGAIDGDVAIALDQHLAAVGWNGLRAQALALQVKDDGPIVHGVDLAQREVFSQAAPRIGVELGVHQLLHCRKSVAHDTGHFSTGSRHHAAAHHQQAVFMAAYVTLDHHLAAMRFCQKKCGLHFFKGVQVQRHAPAMVAVRRFDDYRQAYLLRCFPGLRGRGNNCSFGHRYAAGGKQALGKVLVLGNAFCDCAGQIGFCRPDAPLAGAIAKLHQIAFIQSDVGNSACSCCRHDGCGAWAEVAVVDPGADFFNRCCDIRWTIGLVVDGGHQ